jgi:protein SCO1/2
MMGPRNLGIAVVLGAALAIGIFMAARISAPTQSQPDLHAAFVLPTTMELPEFSLVDQRGDSVTRNTFRGRWNLLFFGFTNCPDICPLTLKILAAARTELTSIRDHPLPRIVFVSVDPERDTPQQLASYVDYFKADVLGVTGDVAELRKLTSMLGIFFAKQAPDGEAYGVDHSAAVIVINPDAEFHALFSAPHNAANFINDLPIIMANYQPRLVATDVVISEPLPGTHTSAGFLSLANNTAAAIRISSIVSPQFETVEIHESTLEDGVARMRRISELVIPAHATVTLQSGGLHLMLMRPTSAGDTVSLQFFAGKTLTLNVDTNFAPRDQ